MPLEAPGVNAEPQSEKANGRFRLLQLMPGFAGVLAGPSHIFEYVNDAFVTISGPRQFAGRGIREVFPELDGQGIYERLDQVYRTGDPVSVRSLPIRLMGEGADRHIDFVFQPIRDPKGSVTGIFVGGYDTTEHVRALNYRDALVRYTARISDVSDPDDITFIACEILGEAMKASRVGYGTIDPVAETLHVQAGLDRAGRRNARGHAAAPPLRRLHRQPQAQRVHQHRQRRTGRTHRKRRGGAETPQRPQLPQCPGRGTGPVGCGVVRQSRRVPGVDADDHFFIKEVAARARNAAERSRNEAELRELNATLRERIDTALREREAAEDALRQAQKMEAVGQLTGGLAHDFNNLLAGISGSLELMQTRMQQGRLTDVDRYMTAAQGAAKRAAALTHRLLAFSRRQTLDPKPTDVDRLAAGMQEMIQRTVGPGIQIEVVGAAGAWPALVDPPQLENALLNLCINARDAMPDGGSITIETANKWLDERAARQHNMPEGQYLALCVTDTGTGMTPDVIARAFEPFFTTKPTGEGTGLGLSMIYGFAQQSGGQVRIYSEVGKGTTVCIYLPRHYGDVEAEALPQAADAAPLRAGRNRSGRR